MPKLRVARAGMQSQTKLRVARAAVAGTAVTYPTLRVARAGVNGTVAVVVTPPAPVTVEPEQTVNLTATLVGGGAADSWTWRRVSGPTPTAGPFADGPACTLQAPSVMPPNAGTLVIGVTATVGGVTSAEKTVAITVLPQTRWSRVHGGPWVGASRPAA